MTTVEPIRKLKDIRKVEKILAKQSLRNLLLFTIGTNCGLRISDILRLNVGDVRGKTYIQIIEKKPANLKKFPLIINLNLCLMNILKKRIQMSLYLLRYLETDLNVLLHIT